MGEGSIIGGESLLCQLLFQSARKTKQTKKNASAQGSLKFREVLTASQKVLGSVFGCIPSGPRCGNVPNELEHRVGPLFLDNYFRGYLH